MNVGGEIKIGNNCLFASIKFRSTDSHRIYARTSNERINPDAPISIGSNVWLAEDVMLLSGANGYVVGARSTVTGEIPDYCLAVGTPAHVVRRDIRWEE